MTEVTFHFQTTVAFLCTRTFRDEINIPYHNSVTNYRLFLRNQAGWPKRVTLLPCMWEMPSLNGVGGLFRADRTKYSDQLSAA
jgi:hypothetical protein